MEIKLLLLKKNNFGTNLSNEIYDFMILTNNEASMILFGRMPPLLKSY